MKITNFESIVLFVSLAVFPNLLLNMGEKIKTNSAGDVAAFSSTAVCEDSIWIER